MIVAGPNLTIDRTSTIPELRPGEVLRLADVVVTPGGKGLNVARAALALGAPAVLVAFVPGHTGRAVAAMIADEGVELQRVPAAGEIRSTSIVLEPDGRATVLNEPGPRLDAWEPLEAAVAGALAGHGVLVCSGSLPPGALAGHGVLVCSGSLPPGAPDDGYARLTALAHAAGARAVVDAGGAVLAAALRAAPDVVTPNLGEAEGVLHGRTGEAVEAAPDARPRALAAAAGLVGRGAAAAVVTAAAAGAAVAAGGEPRWMAAPSARVVNPIGAGDVLTAVLAVALERGAPLEDAVREGIAAAAASVETPKAGALNLARMRELVPAIARAAR